MVEEAISFPLTCLAFKQNKKFHCSLLLPGWNYSSCVYRKRSRIAMRWTSESDGSVYTLESVMYCMEKLLKFTETHFFHLQSKDNNTSSHCCFEARWDDIYKLLPTMSECSVIGIRLVHQPWDENLLLS